MGYELFEGVLQGGVYLVTVYFGMMLVTGGRVAVQHTQRKWKATVFAAMFALFIGFLFSGRLESNETDVARATAAWVYCFTCMLTGILRPEPIHIRLGPGAIARK